MARHRPHLLVRLDDAAEVAIEDTVRHHLERVLRMPSGEVTYTDGTGVLGTGTYADGVITRGAEERVPRPRPLTMAVAPPHQNARVRFVVEKLSELGVDKLIWLQTERGEGRPPRAKKASGWAQSALEQSRGAWLLQVFEAVPVAGVSAYGTPVFAVAGGRAVGELPPIADPVVCVGPEGGFSPAEVSGETIRLDLGPTVLRVETAAIVAAALLRNHLV